MIGTLNLRQRILAGYVVPLLLMVGVAFAVYLQTQRLQALSADAVAAGRAVALAKEAHVGLAQYQRDMRGYLIAHDRNALEAATQNMARATESLDSLAKFLTNGEQREVLARLLKTVDEMTSTGSRYRELVDAGSSAKAVQFFRQSNLTDLSVRVDALIDQIEAHELEILAQRDAERASASTTWSR